NVDRVEDELRAVLPAERFVEDADRLGEYEADAYWLAIRARADGEPLGRCDLAVTPTTEEEVSTVLRVANKHGMPVVPRGGGSGTQGGSVPISGGVLLDLSKMNQIVDVDEVSMTVTVQAGINGRRLETDLNKRGFMMPHYPASEQWATVG